MNKAVIESELSRLGSVPLAMFASGVGLDADDFDVFVGKLAINFGPAYADPDANEWALAKMIFDACEKAKFTKREFYDYLDRFLEDQVYPNWKMGDFFKRERKKLYRYAEVLAKHGDTKGFVPVKTEYVNEVLWVELDEEPLPRGVKPLEFEKIRKVEHAKRHVGKPLPKEEKDKSKRILDLISENQDLENRLEKIENEFKELKKQNKELKKIIETRHVES